MKKFKPVKLTPADLKPVDLKKVKTVPLSGRFSKVEAGWQAKPYKKGSSFLEFWDSLPPMLAASDLKKVARAVVTAREKGRPVILGMGAHPIKLGLSEIIIGLMKSGVITMLSTNGASIIHDFELAYNGRTSEDVAEELHKGTFGMARETGLLLNRAIKKGVKDGLGLGKSVGRMIAQSRFPYKEESLFGNAFSLGVPATVHVSIGADIIHMHPSADGAAIGEATFRDFKLFASALTQLEEGVYINLGSAVQMPEVFLKALTIARNLGHMVEKIITLDMDFLQHYRTRENVLKRPTLRGGQSFSLLGHHEIMLPLLAAGITEYLK
jgi:hypothetical protein